MRLILALVAACGPSFDGTWSDGVHAPLIMKTCGNESYLVFSFDDRSLAGVLEGGDMVDPYFDFAHAQWQGYLRLSGDQLEVNIDANAFTAKRIEAIDDLAGDCETLHQ